jgi:hypothetical protein
MLLNVCKEAEKMCNKTQSIIWPYLWLLGSLDQQLETSKQYSVDFNLLGSQVMH